jgi:uncharacterized membrane protein
MSALAIGLIGAGIGVVVAIAFGVWFVYVLSKSYGLLDQDDN